MKLITLFLCTLASSSWAAEIAWPSSPRTPAKLQEQVIQFDNIPMTTYTVTIAGQKIEISYFGKFSIGANNPKWNTTFVIAEQPAIRWGVAGFQKNEFLPSADPENVMKYVEGLKAHGAANVATTANGELNETLAIAGFKPEVVEYTQAGIKTREFIAEHEGKIFVFSYQAPVKIFESHADTARIIFARMRFLEN